MNKILRSVYIPKELDDLLLIQAQERNISVNKRIEQILTESVSDKSMYQIKKNLSELSDEVGQAEYSTEMIQATMGELFTYLYIQIFRIMNTLDDIKPVTDQDILKAKDKVQQSRNDAFLFVKNFNLNGKGTDCLFRKEFLNEMMLKLKNDDKNLKNEHQ